MQRITWIVFALLLCTGCASSLVKGQSPFVSISSLAIADGRSVVTFHIRNINDVAMNIDVLAITLQIRELTLLRHSGRPDLIVDPNTTEDLVLEQAVDPAVRELLDALQAGDIASLAFSIEGHVRTAEDGNLSFRHQGFLFPVPGRPGQFRATSTRTPDRR